MAIEHRFATVTNLLQVEHAGPPGDDDRRRYSLLKDVPILRDIDDDVLWSLARSARDERFEPGAVVIQRGDDRGDRRFYVVADGAVDIIAESPTGEEDVTASLVPGDYFGEVGLLASTPRNATVRASQLGTFHALSFDAMTFLGVIAEHVLIFRMVRAQRSGFPRESGESMRVRELGLFSSMPLRDLAAILHDAEQESVPAATTIVEQGEPGDRFYVILEGDVEVLRGKRRIATLGTGEFFGETALIFDCPRTATVRTTSPARVWSIARPAFERLVRHYLLSAHHLRDTVARRASVR